MNKKGRGRNAAAFFALSERDFVELWHGTTNFGYTSAIQQEAIAQFVFFCVVSQAKTGQNVCPISNVFGPREFLCLRTMWRRLTAICGKSSLHTTVLNIGSYSASLAQIELDLSQLLRRNGCASREVSSPTP